MPVNTLNGGDFRQSVYRAIRHGLMQAHSMLLEPFYAFHLTIPDKMVGRAMTDLKRRFAVFEEPVLEDGQAILTGCAPVSSLDGYGPCHNEEEVIEAAGYDPDADFGQTQAARSSVPTEPVSTVRLPHAGSAEDVISAALIIADKTDVRRSRVREKERAAFDIHDRVNYAVTESKLKIEKDRSVIALNL